MLAASVENIPFGRFTWSLITIKLSEIWKNKQLKSCATNTLILTARPGCTGDATTVRAAIDSTAKKALILDVRNCMFSKYLWVRRVVRVDKKDLLLSL